MRSPHKKPSKEKQQEYCARAWKRRKADPVRYAKWLDDMRKYAAARRAKAHDDPSIWLRHHLGFLRYKAKKYDIPFNLVETDLPIPKTCPILGLVLCFTSRKIIYESPSVDRVIPSLGYVSGNVRIISFRANTLRSNCLDAEVFYALARDAERLQNER